MVNITFFFPFTVFYHISHNLFESVETNNHIIKYQLQKLNKTMFIYMCNTTIKVRVLKANKI